MAMVTTTMATFVTSTEPACARPACKMQIFGDIFAADRPAGALLHPEECGKVGVEGHLASHRCPPKPTWAHSSGCIGEPEGRLAATESPDTCILQPGSAPAGAALPTKVAVVVATMAITTCCQAAALLIIG